MSLGHGDDTSTGKLMEDLLAAWLRQLEEVECLRSGVTSRR